MANTKKKLKGASYTTAIGRLSFPAVFTPVQKYLKPGAFEYKTTLLFDEKADHTIFNKACEDALIEAYGANEKLWPANIIYPLNDQESLITKANEKGYGTEHLQAGALYANFKTNAKKGAPLVVDGKRVPITDETLVYGGAIARVSGQIKITEIHGKEKYIENGKQKERAILTVYVTPYMSAVQVGKGGASLGGRKSVDEMFDAAAFGDDEAESML